MLTSKNKHLFVEFSEFNILVARATGLRPPFSIEALEEYPVGLAGGIADSIRDFAGVKGGAYATAHVGCYPEGRFLRRFTLDAQARNRNANYFTELMQEEFQIDPAKSSTAVITAHEGRDFDLKKGLDKDLLMAGGLAQSFQDIQDTLLQMAVYPQRLEMSTLSTLGGLMHYAKLTRQEAPTLFLELSTDSAQVLIYQDGSLNVSRSIPFGVNSMYPVIQEELGLKDEASARKLFYSETFDFTDVSGKLLKKLLREVQASTGYFEVQTGQTVEHLIIPALPRNLSWIGDSLASNLGVERLKLDLVSWLEHIKVDTNEDVSVDELDARWFSLFALMADYSLLKQDETLEKEGEEHAA